MNFFSLHPSNYYSFALPSLPIGSVPYFLSLSFHLPPISFSQVVQVLRAIDRDEGGNDSAVHFNIPPDSSTALNFSIRESGGLQSPHSLSAAPSICFSHPSVCIRPSLYPLVCVWNCIVWPLCVCSFVFPIVCFCFSATSIFSLHTQIQALVQNLGSCLASYYLCRHLDDIL